jgi:hypothetical protein
VHYLNDKNGVKDFDIWSFYAQCDDWPFPARWRGTRDFGPSKFGRYPADPPRYSGRRVDLLGRSLPVALGTDPADAIRRYLAAQRTTSAKALAAKAVVLIEPQNRAGEVVWPRSSVSSAHCGRVDCEDLPVRVNDYGRRASKRSLRPDAASRPGAATLTTGFGTD